MKKLLVITTTSLLTPLAPLALGGVRQLERIRNTSIVDSGTYTAHRVDPGEKEIYGKTSDGARATISAIS